MTPNVYDKLLLHRSSFSWRRILLIVLILSIGLGLRLNALGDIFLWSDETANFDEQIYDHMSTTLRRYAALEAQELSVGPAWSVIIALTCKVFGGVVAVGRMPSVLFGTAAILAIFFLVYRFLKEDSNHDTFVPAIFAAILMALSINQLEFSQRIIPYAAVPFLATVIVIIHLKIADLLQRDKLPVEEFTLSCLLFALVSGFSIFLHMSFSIVLAASFLIFLLLGRRLLKLHSDKRKLVLGISALAVLAVLWAWIGNAIHSQSGYRFYLHPYYHRLDLGAIPFLLSRAYDVLTYHLNLVYNGSLYWPRTLNPAFLPLVGICGFGWCYSFLGKVGSKARDLSLLGAFCLAIPGILSLFYKYPFGGIRQMIFMTPFLYAFTAIGLYIIAQRRVGKVIVVIVAAAYIGLWGMNLRNFYEDRIVPYTSRDLVTVWDENGKLKFFGDGGCRGAIRYVLRAYPAIEIHHIPPGDNPLPEAPFFLISPHYRMEDSLWRSDFQADLRRLGYTAVKLVNHPPKYPLLPDYRGTLYTPGNGLYIYKITKEKGAGL